MPGVYLKAVDDRWFKQQQRRAGVTAEQIAARLGRSRTNVSHILNGKQRMSIDWAKAFSEALGVPLAEVLERAGASDGQTAQKLSPGFSDSDAAPWIAAPTDRGAATTAETLGARPGIDVWRVKSDSMIGAGMMPGDFMLVDTHQAERLQAGDVVVAQVYNNLRGTAATVLRRWLPPALVSQPAGPTVPALNVVDGINVLVRGKVIASWRVDM